MSLPTRVLEFCRTKIALPPGARLAVAVSGGLDSAVLLDLLVRLRAALAVDLVVATVDHGLRGAESAADVAFVRGLARDHGLPCYCARFFDLAGCGEEEAARRARHAFLRSVPADRIALAHHRDDQAETVLLRILRSAAPEGLVGMRPVEGRLVRPLLGEPRDAIAEWAAAAGLRWRDDPTNRDRSRERNRLRHEVLPALERVHGGASARLAHLGRLLEADDPDATDRATAWLDRRALQACRGEAARGRLLRRFVAAATGIPDALREAACLRAAALPEAEREGAWIPLAAGWRLASVAGGLCCLPPPPAPIQVRLPGPRRWGVFDVHLERDPGDRRAFCLRPPLPGERLGGQPLREWLRQRRVPAALRPYHPVFCLDGRVVWIPPAAPPAGQQRAGLAVRVCASIAFGDAAGRAWSAEL